MAYMCALSRAPFTFNLNRTRCHAFHFQPKQDPLPRGEPRLLRLPLCSGGPRGLNCGAVQ